MEKPPEDQRDLAESVNSLRDKLIKFPLSSYLLTLFKTIPTDTIPQLTIQVFGKTGSGKSELVNSCLCVARDEPYKNECGATNCLQAVTTKRALYFLTRNIRICDNRGLITMTDNELYEMEQQLKGNRGDLSKDVNFHMSRFAWLFGMNTVKEKTGNLYVPVIVYRCESEDAEDLVPGLEPLIKMIKNISGWSPIIVLTCSEGKNIALVKQAFNDCGCHDILAVENYTEGNPKRTHEQDVAILTFLLHCLEYVQNEAQKLRKI